MMDITPDPIDENKIISLRGDPLEIQTADVPDKFCESNHRAIYVDEHEREVTCQKCGKVIDAFDYLLGWAKEGKCRMQRIKSLDDEIRMTNTELEKVKTALAREKAKVRAINPDAPEVITWKRVMEKRIRPA